MDIQQRLRQGQHQTLRRIIPHLRETQAGMTSTKKVITTLLFYWIQMKTTCKCYIYSTQAHPLKCTSLVATSPEPHTRQHLPRTKNELVRQSDVTNSSLRSATSVHLERYRTAVQANLRSMRQNVFSTTVLRYLHHHLFSCMTRFMWRNHCSRI